MDTIEKTKPWCLFYWLVNFSQWLDTLIRVLIVLGIVSIAFEVSAYRLAKESEYEETIPKK